MSRAKGREQRRGLDVRMMATMARNPQVAAFRQSLKKTATLKVATSPIGRNLSIHLRGGDCGAKSNLNGELDRIFPVSLANVSEGKHP